MRVGGDWLTTVRSWFCQSFSKAEEKKGSQKIRLLSYLFADFPHSIAFKCNRLIPKDTHALTHYELNEYLRKFPKQYFENML